MYHSACVISLFLQRDTVGWSGNMTGRIGKLVLVWEEQHQTLRASDVTIPKHYISAP